MIPIKTEKIRKKKQQIMRLTCSDWRRVFITHGMYPVTSFDGKCDYFIVYLTCKFINEHYREN